MDKLIKKLREDFPSEALSKDTSRGFELTSIKAMFVIERLTDIFGLTGWSYRWDDMEFHDGEWICTVTLSVTIGEIQKNVRQFGGKKVIKNNHTDAKKSAVTDGLTKCASMLGIGHSVFKGEQTASLPSTPKEETSEEKSTGDATDPQRKKIWAMCKNIGVSDKEAKEWMFTRYKVGSSLELTKKQASDFIEFLTEIEKQQQPPD